MIKKRLKPYYLLYFTIPLLYLLLWHFSSNGSINKTDKNDILSFSVRTSNPSVISLNSDNKSLARWEVTNYTFKSLQYAGPINNIDGLSLSVENMNKGDTVTFTGFHLYHHNQLFSVYDCSVENASAFESEGLFNAKVQDVGKPVIIKLKPIALWHSLPAEHKFLLNIFLIFAVVFFVLMVLAPPSKYFIVTVFISLFAMIIFYVAKIDFKQDVSVSNRSQIKGTEVFYNNKPVFNPYKKFNSSETKNLYSFPLNVGREEFLRIDLIDTASVPDNFKIKIKTGLFYATINLSSVSGREQVLNDISIVNKHLSIRGNDPYFILSSTYFIGKIKWLLFLEKNIFLFLSLVVFIILLILRPLLSKFCCFKYRWVHLWYLMIPLTFYLITQPWKENLIKSTSDFIYFSARSSAPSVIYLYNGADSLTSWSLNSPAFKYFQYNGNIKDFGNLHFKIAGLSANDTLTLLSVNYYRQGHVYSIFDKNDTLCSVNNACKVNTQEGSSIIAQNNTPLIVNMLPFHLLNKTTEHNTLAVFVLLLFLSVFFIVIKINSRPVYFAVSCIVTSLMMLVYFWICNDIQWQTTLSTTTPVKGIQVFYNDIPDFKAENKNDVNSPVPTFKTQVEISENNFLRYDIADTVKPLYNLLFCTKAGLFSKSWNYRTIAAEHLLMNDVVRNNGVFYVQGDDPYFILTDADQLSALRNLILLRQNVFLALALFLFLLIIYIEKYTLKYNMSSYFIVVVFFVLISFGFVLRLFNSDSIILAAEMRYANKFPDFKKDTSNVFIKELDNYLKDQIPGRSNIIRINNLIEFSVFGQLVNNPNIHFGKDGWLFYVGGVCRENYENRHPLTLDEMKKMMDVLVARRDWLRERGKKFYIIFPPMAYFVYEDKIGPRMWRYNKKSKVEQLTEYLRLHSDLDVIDLLNPLIEAKNKYPLLDLYYKNNSHWNNNGGYVAYSTMIKYMQRDFANLKDPISLKKLSWVDFDTFHPDLLMHLALEKFFKVRELKPANEEINRNVVGSSPVYPGFSSPAPPYCFDNKKLDTAPTVLLYGDSYSGFLLFYFSTSFKRSTFLFTPLFYPSIVEQENPDIVIQEMNDYSIYNILYPNPPLPEKEDTTQIMSE